jgi:hypothetical protein
MDIPEGSLSGTLQVVGGWIAGIATTVAAVGIPAYRRFNAARLEKAKGQIDVRREDIAAHDQERLGDLAYFERLMAERKAERDAERAVANLRIEQLEARLDKADSNHGDCERRFAVLEERLRNISTRLNDQTPNPSLKLKDL